MDSSAVGNGPLALLERVRSPASGFGPRRRLRGDVGLGLVVDL